MEILHFYFNYDEFIKNKKLKKRQDNDSEHIYQQSIKFYNGKWVPVDMKEAASYCKLAAGKGNINALSPWISE